MGKLNVGSCNKMETKQLIEKFDITLRQYNPKNYAKLQPPLSNGEIDSYFERLEINHPDLHLLYEWKSGFDFSNGIGTNEFIFEFGMLCPLNEVEDFLEVQMPEHNKFLAIVSDIAGDCFYFNNNQGPDYGKIHLYSVSMLSIDPPYSYYDSVSAMLETTIEGYESKALWYNDSDETLDIDFNLYYKIARKINKKCEFWKLQ